MYEKNRRYGQHGKNVPYRNRGKNHDYARRKMRKFIRSLNSMQILCFAIAAIAVFFGILHSFSAMSGSGEEPLAASSDGTNVRIVDDSGPSGAEVPARKKSVPYSGWDPSDKWTEGNPYFG